MPYVADEESFLQPDANACHLDVLAVLHRMRIVLPKDFHQLCREPGRLAGKVPGATRADLALVAGESDKAVKLYEEELVSSQPRPNAWAGLIIALSASAERDVDQVGAAEQLNALLERTELIVSVFRTLVSEQPAQAPQPAELLRWMASIGRL